MKNVVFIALGLLVASGVFAQEKARKGTVAATKYCCANCDYCGTQAGVCPEHNTALALENKYYCPMHADINTDEEGKCSTCQMGMVRMSMKTEDKYCCAKCGFISPVKGQCPASTEAVMKDGELMCAACFDKEGKCDKCGTAMKKIEVKKKASKM